MKKIKRYTKLLFCILFLSYTVSNATEIETVQEKSSLSDLINIALANNTKIQITRFDSDNKKALIDFTKADYLPNLNANAELGYYDLESSTEDDGDNVNTASLTANQLIYDFGKTTSKINSAKKDYIAVQKELISEILLTILDVKVAYYNILNKHQLIGVAKEAVDIDDLQYEQAQEYFKAGVRTKIDVTNAQLQLSNSNLDLIDAQYDLKSSKTELISLIGKNISQNFTVEKEDKEIDQLINELEFVKQELDYFISTGLKDRVEIELYKAQINSQKEKIRSVDAEYFPRIDIDAGYSEKDSDLATFDTTQWNAGVNLKWNFYTGNSTDASLKSNLASLNSLKSQLKQQELAIIQEVTDAYLDTKRTQEKIKVSILNVKLSTENLSLADQRYKSGLNDMIELNDAKLDYTKAKSDLVNTYYSYLTAVANLEYAIGATNNH